MIEKFKQNNLIKIGITVIIISIISFLALKNNKNYEIEKNELHNLVYINDVLIDNVSKKELINSKKDSFEFTNKDILNKETKIDYVINNDSNFKISSTLECVSKDKSATISYTNNDMIIDSKNKLESSFIVNPQNTLEDNIYTCLIKNTIYKNIDNEESNDNNLENNSSKPDNSNQNQNNNSNNNKPNNNQNENEEAKIPSEWLDNGIFSNYYFDAYKLLQTLTIEEKVGQILLARYPSDNTAVSEMEKYNFGGYVLFAKDFRGKTTKEVENMISKVQSSSKIPLIMAVDEEGGSVVRVSSNPLLNSYKFLSPQELYNKGGLDLIKEDTLIKSSVLSNLGINVNLAPVLDISSSDSYIYPRTLGQNATITAEFATTVIEASKKTKVSYTLKHFPGYGNNLDTHGVESTDNRTYEELMNNDLVPFKSGIKSGAEAILISHNIVTSIDKSNPASLSSSMNNLLYNTLNFSGISITDDLDMGATSKITNKYAKSVMAGMNLLIVTNYQVAFEEILNSVKNGSIKESHINKLAFKVLAWKYYKGLINS